MRRVFALVAWPCAALLRVELSAEGRANGPLQRLADAGTEVAGKVIDRTTDLVEGAKEVVDEAAEKAKAAAAAIAAEKAKRLAQIKQHTADIRRFDRQLEDAKKYASTLNSKVDNIREKFSGVLIAENTAEQAQAAADRSAQNERSINEHLMRLDDMEKKGEQRDQLIAQNSDAIQGYLSKLNKASDDQEKSILGFEATLAQVKTTVFQALKDSAKDRETVDGKMYKYATKEEVSNAQERMNAVETAEGEGTPFEKKLVKEVDALEAALKDHGGHLKEFEGKQGSLLGGMNALKSAGVHAATLVAAAAVFSAL